MRAPRRFLSLGLLFLAAVAAMASAQVNPRNMDTAANPRSGSYESASPEPSALSVNYGGPVHREVYALWKTLPGRYEKTEDGSKVTMTLRAVSPYVLFVETRTEAGGWESVERGYLGLGDASPSYTSKKIRLTLSYRPESLRSEWSCILYGAPNPDGITFESEGTDCSFMLLRRVTKLRLDARSDSILLSAEGDGEPVLLKKQASK